jgi:hypothetical protein
LAVLILQRIGVDGITYFNVKRIHSVKGFYDIIFQKLNYMTTLKKQILQNSKAQLTLFPEASHVSRFLAPESEKEWLMTVLSGTKCYEEYMRFNRHGLWLKMFTGLLVTMEVWYSSVCVLIWKTKGTKSNRTLFRLVPLERRTNGTGFGLLPTPVKTEVLGGAQIVTSKKVKRKSGQNITVKLQDLAKSNLLPTPIAAEAKKASINAKQANLHKKFQISGSFQLNPLYVAEMMGFPLNWLELPFRDGEEKA